MKTLVIYYSAQGHTKRIAEEVAENLQADLFEIVPKDVYTEDDLDWTNDDSRCTREHANPELRDVELSSTSVPNWADYDRIIIGYPIWWGISAWPVNSFVKSQDFTGKTVFPFCVSHSSDLGNSDKELQNDAKGGEWQNGHRFFQDESPETIKSWTDSLPDTDKIVQLIVEKIIELPPETEFTVGDYLKEYTSNDTVNKFDVNRKVHELCKEKGIRLKNLRTGQIAGMPWFYPHIKEK